MSYTQASQTGSSILPWSSGLAIDWIGEFCLSFEGIVTRNDILFDYGKFFETGGDLTLQDDLEVFLILNLHFNMRH